MKRSRCVGQGSAFAAWVHGSARPLRAVRRPAAAVVVCVVLIAAGCGGDSPVEPGPIQQPAPQQPAPANSAPTIESITVQGTRPNQPPNFADVSETVEVTATVRDQETAPEQLQYIWSAPAGSFSGTGNRVQWQAPAQASTPAKVTLRLEVVERYGTNLEHRVSRTTEVALHDSVREVGDMARQFLQDFSNTDLKDASVIMRNFGAGTTCPDPRTVEAERNDVIRHYSNFRMLNFTIGPASVTVNFKGRCGDSRGNSTSSDACAVVPVYWESMNMRENRRDRVEGPDIVAAVYSASDARWWLCASYFDGRALDSMPSFYLHETGR